MVTQFFLVPLSRNIAKPELMVVGPFFGQVAVKGAERGVSYMFSVPKKSHHNQLGQVTHIFQGLKKMCFLCLRHHYSCYLYLNDIFPQ
jgi:hypothetical protein